MAQWRANAKATRKRWKRPRAPSMKVHVAAMVDFWNAGVPTLDYGNNIRQVALEEGLENAFAFPGFVPAYIRPLFCRGIGPFRWCALSGDPEDIYKTDAKVKELFPTIRICTTGWTWRASASLSGPARADLLGRLGRSRQAGSGVQRNGAQRRIDGPGCDWPRPSGQRLGRIAQPRNRGDEGRL